jgi:hypothetical protein
MSPALTTITGSIYDARTGLKRTTGRLYIRPQGFIIDGIELVSADSVFVDIPSSGDLNFGLAPSNGVSYVVEFDPDPADPTPLTLKSGYFRNVWTVPAVGPVSITSL